MTGTEELHLSQRAPPPDVDIILKGLSKFLENTPFKEKKGIEPYLDRDLKEVSFSLEGESTDCPEPIVWDRREV